MFEKNEITHDLEEAIQQVQELEAQMQHLEGYNGNLHDAVHEMNNLLNPNHQPQAMQDDLGVVIQEGDVELPLIKLRRRVFLLSLVFLIVIHLRSRNISIKASPGFI